MKRPRLPTLRFRHIAIVPVAGLLTALGAFVLPSAASAAPADTVVNVHYAVTSGSTFIKKLNTTAALGPGTLSSTVDLTTGTTSSTLSLPPATVSFKALGLIPVTSVVELIQNGPAAGTVNLSANTLSSTASVTLKLDSLKVAGFSVPLGNACESVSPTSVTISSQPGFTVGGGGTLAGTYTIPNFAHCEGQAFLINLLIAGPNNMITLNLGKLQLG